MKHYQKSLQKFYQLTENTDKINYDRRRNPNQQSLQFFR